MKEGKDFRRDAKMVYQSTGMLPKQWQNSPKVEDRYEWLFTAFFELTSCRSVGFGVGPIPWTAMKLYADYLELDETEFYFMRIVLSRLDAVYIDIMTPSKGK